MTNENNNQKIKNYINDNHLYLEFLSQSIDFLKRELSATSIGSTKEEQVFSNNNIKHLDEHYQNINDNLISIINTSTSFDKNQLVEHELIKTFRLYKSFIDESKHSIAVVVQKLYNQYIKNKKMINNQPEEITDVKNYLAEIPNEWLHNDWELPEITKGLWDNDIEKKLAYLMYFPMYPISIGGFTRIPNGSFLAPSSATTIKEQILTIKQNTNHQFGSKIFLTFDSRTKFLFNPESIYDSNGVIKQNSTYLNGDQFYEKLQTFWKNNRELSNGFWIKLIDPPKEEKPVYEEVKEITPTDILMTTIKPVQMIHEPVEVKQAEEKRYITRQPETQTFVEVHSYENENTDMEWLEDPEENETPKEKAFRMSQQKIKVPEHIKAARKAKREARAKEKLKKEKLEDAKQQKQLKAQKVNPIKDSKQTKPVKDNETNTETKIEAKPESTKVSSPKQPEKTKEQKEVKAQPTKQEKVSITKENVKETSPLSQLKIKELPDHVRQHRNRKVAQQSGCDEL